MQSGIRLIYEVRDSIAAEVRRIKSTARAIAEIDVYTALSVVAQQYNYVKPAINEKGIIDIKKRQTSGCRKNDPQRYVCRQQYIP